MHGTQRVARLVLPLVLGLALTAAAGPPWIAIEYPANPHDPETRGALMVVRTYHHGSEIPSTVAAEAIGTVDGHRTALPLEVRETSRPGVYAIRGDLPDASEWVVAVTRTGGAEATALVAMSGTGEIMAVRVPHDRAEGRWLVPRAATAAEVDALLRTASAMGDAVRASNLAAGAGAALLLLVAPGAWVARRRRRSDAA